MNKSEGKIVRIPEGKFFGFVRIGSKDYFFHREDFNGDWRELISSPGLYSANGVKVTCDIVESPRGPRVTNVTLIGE